MEIKKFKVLAIDDNPDNLVSLNALIKEAFPESTVFTATTGKRGLELSIQEDPDVILLDIVMPEMDGFQVCRKLKADLHLCDIPVVFVTALKGDQESRIKALECGGEAFLAKPIDETELTAQIRAMVKIKTANTYKRNENERLKLLVEERTNELVKSQAQLKGIFENLQDAYFQADLSGKFTLVSPSAVRIYGFNSVDEIIGQAAELLYANPQERISLIDELHRKGRIEDYVCQGMKKNGSLFWASMNIQLLRRDDGQIVGTEGVVRDISERKLAEEALKESKESFKQIVERSNDIFYRQNLSNSQFEYVSPKVLEIFGYTQDEFLAMDYNSQMACIHTDDLPYLINFVNELIDADSCNRKFIEREFRIRNKQGEYQWIRGNYTLIRDINKNPAQVIGSLTDITAHKLAEKELQESEERFKHVFESANVGKSMTLPNGEINTNQAFCEMLGFTHEELKGKKWQDITPPEDIEPTQNWINSLLSGEKKSARFNKRYIRKDGSIIWADISAVLLRDHEGKPIHFITTIIDITDRKRVSDALNNSLSLTELTIESINNGILAVDHERRVVKTNSRFAEMWRIPESLMASGDGKILMKSILDQLANPDEFVSKLLELYANPESESTDLIYFNDGRIFERVTKPMPMVDKPKGRIWSFLDITDQRSVELALRSNITRLGLAMSTANLAWWEMDLTTGQVVFEPRKAEMLGYPAEKFKHYNDFMELVHPDDYEPAMNAMRLHIGGTINKYEIEYRIQTSSGEYKWFYDIGSVTKVDINGKPQMVAGLVFDISKRKKAESELREKEVQYRNLADSGVALIWTSGTDKLCNYFNQPWLKFTGRTLDQELGNGWLEGVHPDEMEMCIKTYISAFGKQESFEMEYRLKHATGEYRWLQDMGTPNFNIEGEFIGYIGHCFDISDRKQIEIELIKAKDKAEESDRLKSAFLANMSHEIRTPLNSIIGFSELLADPDFNAEQHVGFAQMINSSGNNLLTIISDIMDLSKIEAGQIQMNKTRFSVNHLLKDIHQEYSYITHEKGIELRLDAAEQTIETFLESDKNRIKQVIVNFVGNAIKFTEKGFIEIGFKATDDFVRFHVVDTGIGIPKDFHESVFERFRQVDSSFTRKYGGNGLGLAISKSLIEMLGGRIWMESEQENGSAFYFTIPVNSQNANDKKLEMLKVQ